LTFVSIVVTVAPVATHRVDEGAGRASWIHGSRRAAAGWGGVAELEPDVFETFDELEHQLALLVPSDVAELARARMAMLLGSPAPPVSPDSVVASKVARLPDWPTSALFTARDRACLAVTEQFVMDVTGISQEHIDSLLAHFTIEETYAFVNALWFMEAMQRLGLVVGAPRPIVRTTTES
jgi:hypothetical protein